MKFQHVCPIPGCGKICESKSHLEKHMKEFHNLSIEQQLPGTLETQIQQRKVQKRDKNNPANIDINTNSKESVKEIYKVNINLNRHIFISGQTQSGKSVKAKFIFASLSKDTKAIFYDYKHDPNHERFIVHFPVFTELNEIERHFESEKSLFGKKKDMRVIYRPKRVESDVIKTHSLENPNWKKINDLANYAFKKGNVILFIDEIAPFTSPWALPPALYDCYIMGASRGITVVSITQRPSVVHNTMISEAYTRILFRHELESDRTKLKGLVGSEISNQLQELENQVFFMSYINGKYEKAHLTIPQKLKYIL